MRGTVRASVRWIVAVILAVMAGLLFAFAANITAPTPVDYRIQLPTLPIGDMP